MKKINQVIVVAVLVTQVPLLLLAFGPGRMTAGAPAPDYELKYRNLQVQHDALLGELKNLDRIRGKIPANVSYGDRLVMSAAVADASRRFDIDEDIILTVISIESAFQPMAKSDKGAVGLMQLLPETAVETAQMYGVPLPDENQGGLYDIYTNILLGTAHLRNLHDFFAARGFKDQPLWIKTIVAYNFGQNSSDLNQEVAVLGNYHYFQIFSRHLASRTGQP